MALSRYLLADLLDDVYEPVGRYYADNYVPRRQAALNPNILLSLINAAGGSDDQGITSTGVTDQKNEFKINLDVQHFKPDELNLKVANDYVIVEGKHEEKQDKHGFISRQFTRRYKLPKSVNVDAISSTVSSDGILSIIAPKKVEDVENGRQVPIVQTNQPAIVSKKDSAPADGQTEKMES